GLSGSTGGVCTRHGRETQNTRPSHAMGVFISATMTRAVGIALNLTSVQAKLGRAEEHFNSYRGELRPWIQRKPYTLVGHINADCTEYAAVLEITEQPLLQRWSLIIADSLHNLRSALDNLVYAVAV